MRETTTIYLKKVQILLLFSIITHVSFAATITLTKQAGILIPSTITYNDGDVIMIEGAKLEPNDWNALVEATTSATFNLLLNNAVTEIPGQAFQFDENDLSNPKSQSSLNILSITAPNVTSIGHNAFAGCANLKTAIIPNATDINMYAFWKCPVLNSVDVSGVQTIGTGSFEGCLSLPSVSLPKVAIIPNYAFYGCAALVVLDIPSVTDIQNSAFEGAKSLESIDNNTNITTIGNYAFRNSGIKSLSLNNLTTLGAGSFENNFSLKLINFPALTKLNTDPANNDAGYAFKNCQLLSNISMPLISSLPYGTFYECKSITSISSTQFPSLTTIGEYAFYKCINLSSVDLPDVISIQDYGFRYCALTTVNLPKLTTTGKGSFEDIKTLQYIYLPALQTVGNYCFYNCTGLISANLPLAENVDEYAFAGCTSLKIVGYGAAPTFTDNTVFQGVNPILIIVPNISFGFNPIPEAFPGYSVVIDPTTNQTSPSINILIGESFTFVTGYQPMNGLQWTRNGINIDEETTPEYTTGNLQIKDSGIYSLVFSCDMNTDGEISADEIYVLFKQAINVVEKPSINANTKGMVCAGSLFSETFIVSGTPDITYSYLGLPSWLSAVYDIESNTITLSGIVPFTADFNEITILLENDFTKGVPYEFNYQLTINGTPSFTLNSPFRTSSTVVDLASLVSDLQNADQVIFYEDPSCLINIVDPNSVTVGGNIIFYVKAKNTISGCESDAHKIDIKYEAVQTSLTGEQAKNKIIIYPTLVNAGEILNIQLNNATESCYKVFDINSKIVLQGNINVSQFHLSTSSLISGVYILKVCLVDGTVLNNKFVVN